MINVFNANFQVQLNVRHKMSIDEGVDQRECFEIPGKIKGKQYLAPYKYITYIQGKETHNGVEPR